MNKKLIAVAVAGALVAPAAMADVEVYGKVRASVGFISDDAKYVSGSTRDDSKVAVSSHASRLGFKGSEDLGAGLSAIWQFENTINVDTGGWGGGRDAFVGLKGDWGTAKLGKLSTPYKLSTGSLDPWADTWGDYNAVAGARIGSVIADNRLSNAIEYMTNDINGLSIAAAYIPDVSDDGLADSSNEENDAFSASVSYKTGPMFFTGAFETISEGGSTAVSGKDGDLTAMKVGGSYAFNNKMTTFGLMWENLDLDKLNVGGADVDTDRDVVYGMLTHAMGSTTFKGSLGQASEWGSTSDTGAMFYTLGASHALSKSTEIYAVYAAVANDNSATTGNTGGYTLAGISPGGNRISNTGEEDITAFAIGINHNFSSK